MQGPLLDLYLTMAICMGPLEPLGPLVSVGIEPLEEEAPCRALLWTSTLPWLYARGPCGP